MRKLESALLLVALAFYVWLLRRLGPSQIYSYVTLAGWGVVLTIGVEGISRIFNTLGWRVTIEKKSPAPAFGRLFTARLAGEAIDYLTPSAQLGGQFVMALLVRRFLPIAKGLATVIVAALTEAVGQIGFIVIALLLSAREFAAVKALYWPAIGGLALSFALAGAFFWVLRKRPLTHLWKFAAKINVPGAATKEIQEASAEADAILRRFYDEHKILVMLSCFWYLLAWAMGPVEIYILMVFLNQPVSIPIVLLIEALGLLIERATFMIPAKLVSQEGGKALIMGLLGYPAGVGFAIGLLRRIKEMAWVLFGLGCLAAYRLRESSETPSPSAVESSAVR